MSDPFRLAILGAGVVGRSIARSHFEHADRVYLLDHSADQLQHAVADLAAGETFQADPWEHRCATDWSGVILSRRGTRDDPDAEWLFSESIPERVTLKRQAVAAVQQAYGQNAIYTSNTSTLSITQIAEAASHPERVLGMHFFMPVPERPAVELIGHPAADAGCLQRVREAVLRWRRTPLMVRDSPGFVVNRLLAAYLNSAFWLVCGGVSAQQLADAAEIYQMPLSPLALVDVIGAETALEGGRLVWSRWPHRMDPSPLLSGVVKHRRRVGPLQFLDSAGDFTPAVAELTRRYEHNDFSPPDALSIAKLWAAVMAVDAESILREQVADAATIDLAVRDGLGWLGRGSWLQHVRGIRRSQLSALRERFGTCKSLSDRGA